MSLEAWQEAARYNDAQAEEFGIEEVARQQGIDIETLKHVAEQRALRVLVPGIGQGIRPRAVRLTPEEQMRLGMLTAIYMDGLTIGWRARGLVDGEQ